MRPITSVSVLMPTWQGMEFLERVLASLAGQRLDLPWDFLAIDSGSTDGTWELLGRFQQLFPVPFRRQRIDKTEFDHGDTRNLLAAKSSGELLVFLTQDAIPSDELWLAKLSANFADARVGAAYCRNVARADAELLTRVFSQHDPGYSVGRRETRIEDFDAYRRLNAHDKRVLYNFNDVASAVRRELWELAPFPRTWFGEDVLLARTLLEAGYTLVYDDAATVEHSHDYDEHETRERGRIDGRFNAEWLDRVCVASMKDAAVLTQRQLEADRAALIEAGLAGDVLARELARAEGLRRAVFEGLCEGSQAKPRHAATQMLVRRELKLLFVVHGFPPDTWAGTEIYTFNLASELQRRGHQVTILTRAPASKSVAEGGPANFSIDESQFQGLRVLRLTNRLEHRSIRETYEHPEIEAAFQALLARERPDLVHFQHLIHLSAGLVRVAREAGLATVLTTHDYWAICARVQLIRPDGVRCEENQGAGCFACIKEKGLQHIPRMKKLDAAAGALFDAVASGARASRRAGLKGRFQERWEGFADLRARHAFVTRAYQAADVRISPSRFLRQKLIDTAGFDAHTLIYSDNGMRTDHVTALAKAAEPTGLVRFGFVGSLVWYKGGEVMLRAMQRLAGTRASLNVYGDFKPEHDAHHAELQRLAGPNVRFHGRFDNARLSEVYSEIDVLLVPSVWFENSPITIHEAYLTQTPVIASDIGGMREYVRDGVDGLHFKTGDELDLAAKMRRFLDEPGLVASLSRDWMPIKTIAEDAAATEFRYRALVARVRPSNSRATGVLIDRAGLDTSVRIGGCEPQGDSYLLLRGGRASFAEYDIRGGGGGPRVVRIEQFALGAEKSLCLGLEAHIDGRLLGRFEPCSSGGKDRLVHVEFEVDLPLNAQRLRVVCTRGADGRELDARVARVQVRALARESAGLNSPRSADAHSSEVRA